MYLWDQGYLFHIGMDLIIHHCVRDNNIYDILKYFHGETCGGNFVDKRVACKMFHLGDY